MKLECERRCASGGLAWPRWLAACSPRAAASSVAARRRASSATAAAAARRAPSAAASGEKVNLTIWFWGDADAPGANKWLADAVKAYEAAHPNVTIKVVEQATDTFIATFQAAAAAKSGPDIGAQWATGPVLTQVWGGAITAISDLVPADEIEHWLNTSENTYDGKVWAMPLYLIGIPWVYNKALMAQAGITDAARDVGRRDQRDCKALRAKDIMPFAFGNDTYWTTQLMLQSLDSLDDVVRGRRPARRATPTRSSPTSRTAWKQMVDAKCFNDDVALGRHGEGPGAVRRRQGRDDDRHRRQRAPVGQGPRRRQADGLRSGRSTAPARSRTSTTPRSRRRTSSPRGRSTRRRRPTS